MRRACSHTIFLLCIPHCQIKFLDLIEWTFKRALKTMVHFIWPVMTRKLFFSLPLAKEYVRMYATPYPISWIILILDSEPSYKDKLLGGYNN